MKKALFSFVSLSVLIATTTPLFVPVMAYAEEVLTPVAEETVESAEVVEVVEIVDEETPLLEVEIVEEPVVSEPAIMSEDLPETPTENDEPVSPTEIVVTPDLELVSVSSELMIATPPALPLMSCSAQYLSGTMRDFKQDHPNFQVFDKDPANYGSGYIVDMVKTDLGADDKPEFKTATPFTTNEADFDQWYNDVSGVNLTQNYIVEFDDSDNDGIFTFDASPFFPIDGQHWGNEGNTHNQHFTYEVHSTFEYVPDSYIKLTGDDDMMLFINGKLVTPTMMGIHASKSLTVTFDSALATTLGLTAGDQYSFDFFYAERNKSYAQLNIETDIILNDCMSPIAGPTVDLKVDALDSNTINSGDISYLTWTSTNAVSCTSSDFTTGGATSSSAMGVSVMPTVTKTYTITCTNGAGGTASDAVTLTVLTPSTDPSVTLTATPDVITLGDSSVIEWDSANTTSCSSADFTITGNATSGTDTVAPIVTTTYTIECTDGTDTVTSMVTIMVVPVGPNVTLTASPTSITVGSDSELTWTSYNTTSCTSADFTITAGATAGTDTVTPSTTTTYTIECTDGTDTVTAMVTVTVTPKSNGGGSGGSGSNKKSGSILPQNAGQIASASSLSCPTIKGYWDLGDKSIVYVTRIQSFLNKFEGENLVVDGIYGEQTFEAVKRFQTKYADQILAPWGYTKATGFWYKTTSKMANYLIGCDITDVALEDTGKTADEFYSAPDVKLPSRYYTGYDQVAYNEFCVMTADCRDQSQGMKIYARNTAYAQNDADKNELKDNQTIVLENPEKSRKCGWLRSLFGGCKN